MANNLELKRASAGSGKTYSLAKKYLWYFLTIRVGADGCPTDNWDGEFEPSDTDTESSRRLRNRDELKDSLRHMLAVTFTNKATNEMQQRIVQKLYALAYPGKDKRPDYQKEFCNDLGVDESELTRVCRQAIVVLLENYSDFQVSTIDSFFQLVLRTFAYETDLNDSYGIELDSEFLSKVGLDGVFESVEMGSASYDVKFWLSILLERSRAGGKGWNIFQRKSHSSYGEFIQDLNRLQKEDYKEVRDEVEGYFRNFKNLPQLYEKLVEKYEEPMKGLLDEAKKKAREVVKVVKHWKESVAFEDKWPKCITGPSDHAVKILKAGYLDTPDKAAIKFAPMEAKNFEGTPAKKMMAKDAALFAEIKDKYLEMIGAYKLWSDRMTSPEIKHWKLYKAHFPLLGLLSATMRARNEYLAENNTIELSETNALLQKIIGEADTPFIYERLGARLNHFLIDEFQDTSSMQWDNFRPLLEESLSRGEDNMLIGDPKQSIYRFRNADPSLISYKVEEEFGKLHPGSVYKTGDDPKDNTNWRSDARVVRFNNSLFEFIAKGIQSELEENRKKEKAPAGSSRYNFEDLYSNVVQALPDGADEEKGYVKIESIPGSVTDTEPIIIERVIAQILELLDRGYMMKDIAVLVDKNAQGDKVVDAMIKHNSENPERLLAFVSEQSLKLTSSSAIKIILSTLQSISAGVIPEIREGEDRKLKGVADWNQIKGDFRLYCNEHPEVTMAENLDRFLNGDLPEKSIKDMLGNMQVVTLPALVEGISSKFVGEALCRKDAPFIAAFQDIVLEYCESHPSDIASFLSWWERRADKFSITSPEGIDAVSVMTIHKAKGLEFPCVLVPFTDKKLVEVSSWKKEWKWVEPQNISVEEFQLPPSMPVVVSSSLKGTSHEKEYWALLEMTAMDNINKLYVAFTRAVNELYIYVNQPSKSGTKFSTMLWDYLGLAPEVTVHEIGEKNAEAMVERKEDQTPINMLDVYNVREIPDCIKYKVEETGEIVDADAVDAEKLLAADPRSLGTLQHQVMQMVSTQEDLKDAVNYQLRKGVIDKMEADEIEKFISDRINSPEVKGWFDGSLRVINERSVIGEYGKIYRPDRIMVDDGGHAIVVDYKFGEIEDEKSYGRQVKNYVDSLKSTGKFFRVKGYLWYMKSNKLVFVCD